MATAGYDWEKDRELYSNPENWSGQEGDQFRQYTGAYSARMRDAGGASNPAQTFAPTIGAGSGAPAFGMVGGFGGTGQPEQYQEYKAASPPPPTNAPLGFASGGTPTIRQALDSQQWQGQGKDGASVAAMRRMQQQYGWTEDQIGAELGTGGQWVRDLYGQYADSAPAPAPSGGASFGGGPTGAAANLPAMTIRQGLDKFQWKGQGKDRDSTIGMYDLMKKYGWTPDQIDAELKVQPGWTRSLFGQYGINPDAPGPAPQPSPTTPNGTITNSPIDYRNETIEGRLASLLATDARGEYTNPNVRQAVDRAMQAANGRGILNSSTAVQLAQEAAIAKAIEIAGPDAQRYSDNRRANIGENNRDAREAINFERERQLAREEADRRAALTQREREAEDANRERTRLDEQDFTLRGDYQRAASAITANYQRQIDTVNASQMTPEDKTIAIARLTRMRDGEVVYNNALYSRMPRWRNEWLAVAVPNTASVPTATDPETLNNIINDPAQPEAVRQQARERLAALAREPEGFGGAAGTEDGREINWDEVVPVEGGMVSGGGSGANLPSGNRTTTVRKQYEAYQAGGGKLTPKEWYARIFRRPAAAPPIETSGAGGA